MLPVQAQPGVMLKKGKTGDHRKKKRDSQASALLFQGVLECYTSAHWRLKLRLGSSGFIRLGSPWSAGGGCTTFSGQSAFVVFVLCSLFFVLVWLSLFCLLIILGPTGQWLFSALWKTNTPRSAATMTTCRIRATHTQHNQGMISKALRGGGISGAGQTTRVSWTGLTVQDRRA